MEQTSGANLNDPLSWGEYIPPPSEVNVRRFQKRLDRIAGKSASGLSVLRLVWGCDERHWRAGDWRLRYAFHTFKLPNGDDVDIGTPRWYLEELIEPVQYREEWARQRYEVDVDSVELRDVLGPPPEKGWHVPATLIAEHDGDRLCCKALWEESRRSCWGRYRAPGDDTLEMVAQAVKLRDADKMYNRPDEPLSQEAFDECWKEHHRQRLERDRRRSQKVRDVVDQFITVFGGNFSSTDPARHHWGKYHWLSGHSLSGQATGKK